MKNLKEIGKKLYSKNIIHVLVMVLLLVLGYFAITFNMDYIDNEKNKFDNFKRQQEQLIFLYQAEIDSINIINEVLTERQDAINYKIDSISQQQNIINQNHENEINIIRDATLSEHSQWFSAKIDSIRHNYKPDNK